MDRRTAVLALAALVAAAPLARAHEGHAHTVMGTVTAVHADKNQVEVKTMKGETVTFTVNASTKYLKGNASVALSALTPGTRVVAEGKMTGGAVVAETVRVGEGTAEPVSSGKPAPKSEKN